MERGEPGEQQLPGLFRHSGGTVRPVTAPSAFLDVDRMDRHRIDDYRTIRTSFVTIAPAARRVTR